MTLSSAHSSRTKIRTFPVDKGALNELNRPSRPAAFLTQAGQALVLTEMSKEGEQQGTSPVLTRTEQKLIYSLLAQPQNPSHTEGLVSSGMDLGSDLHLLRQTKTAVEKTLQVLKDRKIDLLKPEIAGDPRVAPLLGSLRRIQSDLLLVLTVERETLCNLLVILRKSSTT